MLKSLHIKNLAIIDEAHLDLTTGFTVLTGETGAGKSILLDALGLILGTRADPNLVRQGCDKAEITAEFDLADAPAARAWLDEQELADTDDPAHCLIRRIVTSQTYRQTSFSRAEALEKDPENRLLWRQNRRDKPRSHADQPAHWRAILLRFFGRNRAQSPYQKRSSPHPCDVQ